MVSNQGLWVRVPFSVPSLCLLYWYHEFVCPVKTIYLLNEKSITHENKKGAFASKCKSLSRSNVGSVSKREKFELANVSVTTFSGLRRIALSRTCVITLLQMDRSRKPRKTYQKEESSL